jgi:hypothetical protein
MVKRGQERRGADNTRCHYQRRRECRVNERVYAAVRRWPPRAAAAGVYTPTQVMHTSCVKEERGVKRVERRDAARHQSLLVAACLPVQC